MKRGFIKAIALVTLALAITADPTASATAGAGLDVHVVAAIGDSHTESGAYLEHVHAELGTFGPAIGMRGQGAEVIGRELAGVIAGGADVVIIQAGVNDIASGRDMQRVADTLDRMYRQAAAAGVAVVAVPVMPWGRYMQRDRLRGRAAELATDTSMLNDWIARYQGIAVVDVRPLGDGAGNLRREYDAGDGLHLSPNGQARLGQLVAAAIRRIP